MTELTVNMTKTIQAPIGKVFDAWLDPEMLSQFILPAPGMSAPEVTNNPIQGGEFSIIMQVGEDKIPHTGIYLVVDKPHQLVFTWQSPCSSDGSEVALQFSAINDKQTQLELTHTKFVDEETRANHEGGWGNILGILAEIL